VIEKLGSEYPLLGGELARRAREQPLLLFTELREG
jgi:hypothetical protein